MDGSSPLLINIKFIMLKYAVSNKCRVNAFKKSLFLIFLTLLLSCKDKDKRIAQTVNNKQPVVTSKNKAPGPEQDIPCDTTITNDELSAHFLKFNVFQADSAKIKKLFNDNVIVRVVKKEEQGGIFYMYNFSSNSDTIRLFYKPEEGFYIEDAHINSTHILLNKKIFIGMSKADFLQKLALNNITCNIINVENEEATFKSSYIFRNSKLFEIKSRQIME